MTFWVVVGVIAWAFTFSYGWHQNRVASEEAAKREAAIAHEAAVRNCRAINELTREQRLAWLDAGYPAISERFEAEQNCAALP